MVRLVIFLYSRIIDLGFICAIEKRQSKIKRIMSNRKLLEGTEEQSQSERIFNFTLAKCRLIA